MLLSELAETIEAMISIHGDHKVYYSGDSRVYQHIHEESLFFSEDEEVYYI